MNLDAPIPPPEPGRTIPFGLQVAYGFFLPAVACLVTYLGIVFSVGVAGRWSSIGIFAAGGVGLLLLLAGIWLATKRGWKGAALGILLFAALILLLIGLCFAMLARGR